MEKNKKPSIHFDFQLVSRKGSNKKTKAPYKSKQNIDKFSLLHVEIDHPLTEGLGLPPMDHVHAVSPPLDNKAGMSALTDPIGENQQDNGVDNDAEMYVSPLQRSSSKDETYDKKVDDIQLDNFASQIQRI